MLSETSLGPSPAPEMFRLLSFLFSTYIWNAWFLSAAVLVQQPQLQQKSCRWNTWAWISELSLSALLPVYPNGDCGLGCFLPWEGGISTEYCLLVRIFLWRPNHIVFQIWQNIYNIIFTFSGMIFINVYTCSVKNKLKPPTTKMLSTLVLESSLLSKVTKNI